MEKNRWALIIVAVVICFGLIIYFTKEERPETEQAKTMPKIERISKDGRVEYIDRRGLTVTTFIDKDQSGYIDVVQIRRHGQAINADPIMTLVIDETIYEANRINFRNIRDADMNHFHIGRVTLEASYLYDSYLETKKEYFKLRPGDYPENVNSMTKVSQDKILAFLELLSEELKYCQQARTAKTQQSSEINQLKSYLAFLEMRRTYRGLNNIEKRYIFSWKKLPIRDMTSCRLGVDFISGIVTSEIDPRGFFEFEILTSYMETDYMSGWSIAGTDKWEKIVEEYHNYLRMRGHKVSE